MKPREHREPTSRAAEAAKQLLSDLGFDKGDNRSRRVDVFEAIDRVGAVLMFRPFGNLTGTFTRRGTAVEIVLNTNCAQGVRRFSAARLLGRFVLGHGPRVVVGGAHRRDSPGTAPDLHRHALPLELELEDFASHFLMPIHLIETQMERRGWKVDDLANPEIVHQASLRYGVDYGNAVRGLERAGLIRSEARARLLNTKPDDLKRRLLDGEQPPDDPRSDVWLLTERDHGAIIEAGREDLFVFRLMEACCGGYMWDFDELRGAGFTILKEGRKPISEGVIGGPAVRRVVARAGSVVEGEITLRERRPWHPSDNPQSLTFLYRAAQGGDPGLFGKRGMDRPESW